MPEIDDEPTVFNGRNIVRPAGSRVWAMVGLDRARYRRLSPDPQSSGSHHSGFLWHTHGGRHKAVRETHRAEMVNDIDSADSEALIVVQPLHAA